MQDLHIYLKTHSFYCPAKWINSINNPPANNWIFPVPPHIAPFDFGHSTVNAGASTSLYCMLNEGDSPVTFDWFLNGKPVSETSGILVTRFGAKSSILNIDSVRESHGGRYICKATNWAGTALYAAELSVKGDLILEDVCFILFFFLCCFDVVSTAKSLPIYLYTQFNLLIQNVIDLFLVLLK